MSRKLQKKKHLFLNWLKANRSRFKYEPIIVQHHHNYIDLLLAGITNALRIGYGTRNGITVAVYWLGEHCDFLGDFEVAERKSSKGFYCAFCDEDLREYYPTREELWIHHVFETFLEWCNTKLVEFNWLEIKMGRGTSVRLLKEKPEVAGDDENLKRYFVELHVM